MERMISGNTSAYQILDANLRMKKVIARLVNRQMIDVQEFGDVKYHFRHFSRQANALLNRIITSDEKWMHYARSE